jgi:hypothetical protein
MWAYGWAPDKVITVEVSLEHLLPGNRGKLVAAGEPDSQRPRPALVDMGPFLRQEGRYPPGNPVKYDSRKLLPRARASRSAQGRPIADEMAPGITLWVSWLVQRIRQSD